MLWVQLPPEPLFVLVEQSGVLATLSRWRMWVQIPSRTLDGTVRKPAKRPSSNLGDRLWVRFPPVLPDQGVELADTRCSERRALAAWEFDSPLGHCGVDWSLVPARSHKPFDAGSNPASATSRPSTQT